MIHYRNAYLYPNGDLLAIYEAGRHALGLRPGQDGQRLAPHLEVPRARITIWMSPPTATSMF